MTKADTVVSRSKQVNSDMDEDAHDGERDALPTPDSNKEVSAPVRKTRATRGRPKATATSTTSAKVKPTSRRLSGRSAVAKKEAPIKNKNMTARTPLKEQKTRKNQRPKEAGVDGDREQGESDGYETTASFDELVTKEQVPKRGRPIKKQQKPRVIQETKAVENDGEFEYTPTVVRQTNPLKKSSQEPKQATAGKRNPSADPPYASKVIPETQAMPMDLDSSNLPDGDADPQDTVPDSVLQKKSSGKEANSRQRQPFLSTTRSGGGASDKEKMQDDTTRRELEEMTRKYEDVDMKYKALKEVGIKEAYGTFVSLKEKVEAESKGK